MPGFTTKQADNGAWMVTAKEKGMHAAMCSNPNLHFIINAIYYLSKPWLGSIGRFGHAAANYMLSKTKTSAQKVMLLEEGGWTSLGPFILAVCINTLYQSMRSLWKRNNQSGNFKTDRHSCYLKSSQINLSFFEVLIKHGETQATVWKGEPDYPSSLYILTFLRERQRGKWGWVCVLPLGNGECRLLCSPLFQKCLLDTQRDF